MKIGIMTFHSAPNHGAALQAYALQVQLQKMGHDPFFINYHRGFPPRKGLLGWVGSTPLNTLHKVGTQIRRKVFSRFQRDYLNIGREYYVDHVQLQKNPPPADVYICGSDQVWNPEFISLEKDEQAYWLNFGDTGVKRIAYAASFGVGELETDLCSRYAAYAKRFDAISVRETDGLELIKRLDIHNAVRVPDPTLLLMPDDYRHVEERLYGALKPFLFSYQIETQKAPLALARQINNTVCSELGLKRYESHSTSFIFNVLNKTYISPRQWLPKLRQSSFVVTNSFHGTVFSLLYHRPFIVLLRTGSSAGKNSRVTSLLNDVGLLHRAVTRYDSERIEELYHEELDWSLTDARIQCAREIGFRFLSDVLK